MSEQAISQEQASQCPYTGIGTEFDPHHGPDALNPYLFFARARREEPVFFSPKLNLWFVSRYDDIVTVLKDPRRFSSVGAIETRVRYTPEVLKEFAAGIPITTSSVGNSDPPEHTRVRRSVSRTFTPKRVASFEPLIREFGNRLIDQFMAQGEADLIEQFATPFPMLVIFSLIGVPESAMPTAKEWVQDFLRLLFLDLPQEQQITCVRGMVSFQRFLRDLIEQRRTDPQEDLTSDLVQAVESGQAELSIEEMVILLNGLVVGGFETTIDLLGSCFYHLLTRPEYWQDIVRHPEHIPAIIEETLRIDGPLLGQFRIAKEDAELGGAQIPKGARLCILFGSANHDEQYFAQPETFNPQRENLEHHLRFGQGIHVCIGSPLARMEAKVALELLSQRIPDLHLDWGQVDTSIPYWTIRKKKSLRVLWTPDI